MLNERSKKIEFAVMKFTQILWLRYLTAIALLITALLSLRVSSLPSAAAQLQASIRDEGVSSEDCFIRLTVGRSPGGAPNERPHFRLEKIEAIAGNFGGLVQPLPEGVVGEYVLSVVSRNLELSGQYRFPGGSPVRERGAGSHTVERSDTVVVWIPYIEDLSELALFDTETRKYATLSRHISSPACAPAKDHQPRD